MNKVLLCGLAICIQAGCVGAPADPGDIDEPADQPAFGRENGRVIQPGPCVGDECNGQKPYATGCINDAVTVETVRFPDRRFGKRTNPGGRLVLYHSPSCDASWAVVYRDRGYYSTVWLETPPGDGQTASIADSIVDYAGRPRWTGMVHAPSGGVRACVDAIACATACDAGRSNRYCTDYH